MKESEIHALLCNLFAWHLKSEETGYDSLNILARVSQGGRMGVPGHKILCKEMHPDTRRVQKAFNGLEFDEKAIVVTKHMPPPMNKNKTPKRWGEKEMAEYLQIRGDDIPAKIFRERYRVILRKLGRCMNG
jgi:hypothetical protein